MRLWIFSDLHLEAQPSVDLPIPDADVAVVAGDVCKPIWKSVEWLAGTIAPYMPVVFVAGNHEFYGGSVDGCTKRGLAAAGRKGVCMLHDSDVVVGDTRFVGGTLWTDYALGAVSHSGGRRDMDIAHAMNTCGSLLADHTAIHTDDSMLERWQPEHARAAHVRTKARIEGALRDGSTMPTVVVTHHAPHPGSGDRQYWGSSLNPAFASDLSEMIWDYQPCMWIHGHVHNSALYTVGETVVVCNPRGYGDENPAFDPGLVLAVPKR
ncbi:metallophosphoesterase [Microvirga makkahensis]|uniref:Metallophosphoesterase n=2 Tax=Microvirga makkahensis TaxID=1128670 RepID=A0A7X3MNS5_9HYPH|nr:metallophosphoesterase [Microvirga makkahensis]